MDEAFLIERLLLFGLGRQEALVYFCLLKNDELTGYEVSKKTGISRSNVYNALASMVEHGAAYVKEGTSTRYIPVPMAEFCDNRLRSLKEVSEELVKNSPKPTISVEGYITIEGFEHIKDKIYHMLRGASSRIYFSAAAGFLKGWEKEIQELLKRGIKVVLISDSMPMDLSGIIFYQSLSDKEAWEDKEKQVRLIIDSAYVLTGEVEGSSTDTCLYSAQRNFVNVFKEAMSNEIKLIELSDVGNKGDSIKNE